MGITRGQMFIRMLELRAESRKILSASGPYAAADYLAAAQYKIVAEMLEAGQITTEQALLMATEIDGYKAEFLGHHE